MMNDTLLIGGFGHNDFRWTNLVFIPKNIQNWFFRKKTRRLSIYFYKGWVYIMRDCSYVLALG